MKFNFCCFRASIGLYNIGRRWQFFMCNS